MSGRSDLPLELVRRLATVRSVGAITGAGISQESGIRTYRGSGGLYDDPEEGDRTIEALSGPTMQSDPDRTWRVVSELIRQSADAEPNAAHRALVEIERAVDRFALLTQNVDGLHARAGSRNVIDIHGDVSRTRCGSCGDARRWESSALCGLEGAPRCGRCGGILRPDVVLFGELLPPDKVRRMQRAFYDELPDLVLAVGTSALFPYITEPVLVAARAGKLAVEINPEPTLLSRDVDFALRGAAGTVLPEIATALASRHE
jgi:NAD-dependent deacetylase